MKKRFIVICESTIYRYRWLVLNLILVPRFPLVPNNYILFRRADMSGSRDGWHLMDNSDQYFSASSPRKSIAKTAGNDIITYHNKSRIGKEYPDGKIHAVNMGPTWGRQDPGGPQCGPRDPCYLGMHADMWRVGIISISRITTVDPKPYPI